MADDDSGGGTVGVWIPEDSDIIEEFDEAVANRIGVSNYSRSEQIREAMRTYAEIHRLLDELDYPEMSDHSRLATVRQAILDKDRRDREESP